jgi:hypothetical protein
MVSGLSSTAQQAGAALGLAVLAAIAAAHTSASTAAGVAPLVALRSGYSLAFLVAAGFVVAALVITALGLRHPPTPAEGPPPGGLSREDLSPGLAPAGPPSRSGAPATGPAPATTEPPAAESSAPATLRYPTRPS